MNPETTAMIGLRRGTVKVVSYRPEWRGLFLQERSLLQNTVGHLAADIQHVGSTAVPGLPAKPILDIAVAVQDLSLISRCAALLCSIGYIDRGDNGADGGYLLVKEAAPQVRTHHLHVVAIHDPQWRQYLLFRDLLRADETLRSSYARLKHDLRKQFQQDRRSYTASKQDFIRDLLDRHADAHVSLRSPERKETRCNTHRD